GLHPHELRGDVPGLPAVPVLDPEGAGAGGGTRRSLMRTEGDAMMDLRRGCRRRRAATCRLAAVLLLGLAPMLPAAGIAQVAREGEFLGSDGVRIHSAVRGAGPPVLLVHGFAVSAGINWAAPGILDSLAARFTVIAPD